MSSTDGQPASGWRVGVDIGGTFTDIVALDSAAASVRTAKVPTRHLDPLASLHAALRAVDLRWNDVALLVHGTTLVTNAIIEDRLADVAFVTTEGFADILAIGRQNRRFLYALAPLPKLPPMVPEERRFELRERMGPDGQVKRPLDDSEIDRVVDDIRRSGVRSAAVSLLHAYAAPAHEIAVGKRLAEALPYVSLSHRVNPEEREFERSSATVLNAAVMPIVADYLDVLEAEVPKPTRFYLFHSAGGMAASSVVRERPLVLALSGPAAGVTAARRVAKDLALDNLLTLDMGGTTTDVCLIRNGKPEIRREASLAERPIRQPMIAVHSIGAGGGSIAAFESGLLQVGPHSAGASPGPACYGLGGSEPTVTDAHLVLGYLDAEKPLGGSIRLDASRARTAISGLADKLGLGAIETALGVLRVANANMVRAIRNVTVDRGIDGRQCILVAFGGAGPLHAATLARDFGIRQVIVPAFSSAYSALGCVIADLSQTRQRTVRMASRNWDVQRLEALRRELLAAMGAEGDGNRDLEGATIEDTALIRYRGQSYAVEVPWRFPADVKALTRDFRAMHERLYGFSTDEEWELESMRVTASRPSPAVEFSQPEAASSATLKPHALSRCWFSMEAALDTPRYWRDRLPEKARIPGPAIVEDAWSTVTVPPGAVLAVAAHGHLSLTFETPP